MSIPVGMTAEKLRLIADWLDTYDKIAERVVLTLEGDIEIKGRALVAARGKNVQVELRCWADELDASDNDTPAATRPASDRDVSGRTEVQQ